MLNEYLEEIKKTEITAIKVTTSSKKNLDLKTSKLSGIPYWPSHMAYPYMNEKPMKLVWQINFADVKDFNCNLELPKNGILQFFIECDHKYIGMTFDGTPFKTKTVYHENTDDEQLEFNSEISKVINSNDLPWEEQLNLNFSSFKECLGLSDEYTVNKTYSFKENLTDDDFDYMYEEYENSGSKIGGYAYFTQSDPRCYDKEDKNYQLLFQLDSDDNLMWGDSGVGNWFITLEDLKNKNFTNLLYNWDCC